MKLPNTTSLLSKRASERKYYKKYREKKIIMVKAWQEKNKDKVRRYSKAFYAKNKDYWAQWYLDKKAA